MPTIPDSLNPYLYVLVFGLAMGAGVTIAGLVLSLPVRLLRDTDPPTVVGSVLAVAGLTVFFLAVDAGSPTIRSRSAESLAVYREKSATWEADPMDRHLCRLWGPGLVCAIAGITLLGFRFDAWQLKYGRFAPPLIKYAAVEGGKSVEQVGPPLGRTD